MIIKNMMINGNSTKNQAKNSILLLHKKFNIKTQINTLITKNRMDKMPLFIEIKKINVMKESMRYTKVGLHMFAAGFFIFIAISIYKLY